MVLSADEGSRASQIDFLRLIRSENVGPITCRRLLAQFGSAAAALEALPELARRGGRRRPVRLCPPDEAERQLDALEDLGARVLTLADPEYPLALAAIDDPPPVISVLGDAALLTRRAVAVVGARNASANGRRFAKQLAADLGRAGLVVTSGLARGIDTAAHEGALDGGTVAVLAGGPDVVYPRENDALYEAVRERGAVVSEMPAGLVPQARHFPRRNRLISGLSVGVLVVEAAPRSGSLITARLALEQGREVFAVPGSPLDPRARGCNHLIRQGAVLTESAEDVVEALEGFLAERRIRRESGPGPVPEMPESGQDEATEARAIVKQLLGPSPVLLDEVARQAQLSAAMVNRVLLELELAGRVVRHPGNRVSLTMDGDDTG
ncbi:MAG: DNA-processing protein DprA [Kiloniellales bacterium]|nr:DNA-processing protein DprA [Kiloniellales bacterium]